MDGVNLYCLQSVDFYVWIVIVINKIMHPWFYMENEHLTLAHIVSSRIQVKRTGVYMHPLINEFKKLYNVIHVYDA